MKDNGLVMVCDVDLAVADATRIHTIEVARAFVAEGLAVDLVARGPDPEIDGVNYRRAIGSDWQRLRRIATINIFAIRRLWLARRATRRLYIRNSWTIMPIVVVGRMLGYRIVSQNDGIPFGRGFEGEISVVADYTKRLALVAMGRLAHGTVAITPQIKDLLVRQYRFPAERIAILPNGADVDFFTPMPRDEAIARVQLDPGHSYAVFCGGFHPWIDFDFLLKAFAIVHHQQNDARLLLVGDGVERDLIERVADELMIRDAVVITGVIYDRTKVKEYLGAATVTLVAHHGVVHRSGVFSSKLAEYMAAGRAVVAKYVPMLAEAIEEAGAGIVVPDDPQAMAETISGLLSDPERADELGAAGRRAVEEKYSWRAIIRQTLLLFDI